MTIKLKLSKYYRVILIRKPLIGAVMAGGGGGGSPASRPPIYQEGARGGPIYGVSTEEIGVTMHPSKSFELEGFVSAFKGNECEHLIVASLKDVHSVEFIPVYDETSL